MFRKYLTPLDRIYGTEKVTIRSDIIYKKIYTPEKEHLALALIKQWQKNGEIIALVGGTYDVQHSSHKEELEVAKALSDRVIVHPSTDERSKVNKGKTLATTMQERAKHLAHSSAVDIVLYNYNGPSKLDILKKIKPNRYLYSTTSSTKYFDEIKYLMETFEYKLIEFVNFNVKSYRIAINLEGQWCQLCVFNEGCQTEIRMEMNESISQYLERCKNLCLEYNSNKFTDNENNSGSVIKRRIIEGYISDNINYFSCDLPSANGR